MAEHWIGIIGAIIVMAVAIGGNLWIMIMAHKQGLTGHIPPPPRPVRRYRKRIIIASRKQGTITGD